MSLDLYKGGFVSTNCSQILAVSFSKFISLSFSHNNLYMPYRIHHIFYSYFYETVSPSRP